MSSSTVDSCSMLAVSDHSTQPLIKSEPWPAGATLTKFRAFQKQLLNFVRQKSQSDPLSPPPAESICRRGYFREMGIITNEPIAHTETVLSRKRPASRAGARGSRMDTSARDLQRSGVPAVAARTVRSWPIDTSTHHLFYLLV